MEKYLLKGITAAVLILGIMVGIQSANAQSEIRIIPAAVTATPGDTFEVPVLIYPRGTDVHSVSVRITYPEDLLSVESFDYDDDNDDLVPMTGDEFDRIDEDNGVIVKSAGFTDEVEEATLLGTVTFKALKKGIGRVEVSVDDTVVLDEDDEDMFVESDAMATIVSVGDLAYLEAKTASIQRANAYMAGLDTSARQQTLARSTTQSTQTTISQNTTQSAVSDDMSAVDDDNTFTLEDDTETDTSGAVLGEQTGGDDGKVLGASTGNWRGFIVGAIVLLILIAIVYALTRRTA